MDENCDLETKLELTRKLPACNLGRRLFGIFTLFCYGIFFTGCLQSRDELTPASAALLLGEVDLGAPGTIGLDLRINIRNWTRGCETRMGNLGADAYAWKTQSDLGVINGGAIRDNTAVEVIPKGTDPTVELFKTFMTFANKLTRVRIRMYRLKQAMESSVSRLNTTVGERSTETADSDGPQTGNCYRFIASGSGRFLHISRKLSIEVNPFQTAQATSGNQADQTLAISTPGRRIVKMMYDGILYYNDPSGDTNANASGIPGQPGWGIDPGSSCTVNNVVFTNSLACRFVTIGVTDFQQKGGDSIPSFNPNFPGNGDGSIFLEAENLGDDAESIVEYIKTVYTDSPVFPRVTGRIILP